MHDLTVVESSNAQLSIKQFIPSDYIESFIASRRISESTRRSYRAKLKAFFIDFTNDKPRPTTQDVVDFMDRMDRQGHSDTSVVAYITPLKLFYRWAASERGVNDITADPRINPKIESTGYRKDPLTAEQAASVMQSIHTETLTGKRDFALMALLFNAGLRTIEVSRARVEDIDQEQRRLYVQGKGRRSREEFVMLNDRVVDALAQYFAARGTVAPSEPLFASTSRRSSGKALAARSIQDIVSRHLETAGVKSKRITPHSTRHTFACIALQAGVDLTRVRDELRHRSVQTTEKYARMIDRESNSAVFSVSI